MYSCNQNFTLPDFQVLPVHVQMFHVSSAVPGQLQCLYQDHHVLWNSLCPIGIDTRINTHVYMYVHAIAYIHTYVTEHNTQIQKHTYIHTYAHTQT